MISRLALGKVALNSGVTSAASFPAAMARSNRSIGVGGVPLFPPMAA